MRLPVAELQGFQVMSAESRRVERIVWASFK
jgi:hypothetical protein